MKNDLFHIRNLGFLASNTTGIIAQLRSEEGAGRSGRRHRDNRQSVTRPYLKQIALNALNINIAGRSVLLNYLWILR